MRSNDAHFDELTEYVDHHWRSQREDRDRHRELRSYMTNEFYPGQSQRWLPRTSIPLISMTARAWSRYLIAKSPRVAATPIDPGMQSWAESRETSTNQRIQRSNLARELRDFGNQSLCSLGIMHIGPVYEGTNDGYRMDLETRSIDRVDWICDLGSAYPETCDVQGHRFRMPLIDVHQHPMFDPELRKQVFDNGQMQREEDPRFRQSRFHDLYRYVDMACVYERRRNKLVYFPWEQRHLKLAEIEWQGPVQGPYLYLYYEKPPGVATPIAPLSHLAVKHRSCNILDDKAMEQANASKGLFLYTNASKEEAQRQINAYNNQAVLAESGAARYMHIGGAAGDLVAMQEKQRRDFSWGAGGLDTYAGLQTMAPTLGQERLLRGAANEMLSDMGEYAQLAMHDLCNRLFWFDGRDPDPEPQLLIKRYRGQAYPAWWTKQHREFALLHEFNVTVEPYSYVMRTPESRLADVLGALQIFQTLRGEAAAQGMMIDVEAVVRTVAKAKNLPELYDVLILNQDPQRITQLLGGTSQQNQPDPMRPYGNYRRESVSDGSGEGMELMRMFNRNDNNTRVAA